MNRDVIILAVVIFLVLMLGVQAYQIGGLGDGASVPSQKTSGGESYDEMMARMHPDQVQKQANSQRPAAPTMVGGC